MSELTDSLRAHGQQHMGTDLGGLLQWAALHIDAQDDALAELREEYAREKSDRVGLEGAMGAAKEAIEAALAAVSKHCAGEEFTQCGTPPIQTRIRLWHSHTHKDAHQTH